MQIKMQKVVVLGLGYIGLPTASMLATKGHTVVGVDIREDVVSTINSGNIHIVEPDLDVLVKSAVNSGRLTASLVPEFADTFIIAVPTPFKQISENSKTPDLSFVEDAARTIAPFLQPGNLVILESTSPVGTTDRIQTIFKDLRPDLISHSQGASQLDVHVAHCPERVLPGQIIRELVDNDRIIGGVNRASAEAARNLYKTFCSGNIYLTDAKTAEMAKLTENAFRDVNIAFANELSMICDELDINVWELIQLANKHPRVNVLQPGPGVGGHCIAVDPWFIIDASPNNARLIRAARDVNDRKPRWVLEKISAKAERFKNPVIGCLGLTFKANIDDIRESPALEITKDLIRSGIGEILACEPNLNGTFTDFPLYPMDEVVRRADILVLLVDHAEFSAIATEKLTEKIVIDVKGLFRT